MASNNKRNPHSKNSINSDIEESKKVEDKQEEKSILPVVTCPTCGGNCYSMSINFRCEKCSFESVIDSSLLDDNFELSKVDSDAIKEYLVSFAKAMKSVNISSSRVNEDALNEYPIIYKGQILDMMKRMKKDYGFPALMMVVKYITEGFVFVLKKMKEMPGSKVYLVDELGNRSEDIKKAFLREAYKAFNKEQDTEIVDKFLKELIKDISIQDARKKIEKE